MKITHTILASFIISFNLFAADLNPNDIVKKADLKRGLGNVSHSFNVTITNQDDKREVFKVNFKDVNTSLTIQTEPERARGRKLLMKDYDIWLYTPNIKKPLRISLEQKLTGEVANGDIARTNYAEDYEATLLGTEKREKVEVYKLELKAKNKKVTYGRIEYIVAKSDFMPMEATFYALSGTKMTIRDYLQKDKFSVLVFSDQKFEKFNDSIFNKDRLEF